MRFVFVVSAARYAADQLHGLGICQGPVEAPGIFSDLLLNVGFPFPVDLAAGLTSDLFSVPSGSFYSFSGSLAEIVHFLLRLFEGKTDLGLGKRHQEGVHTLQNRIDSGSGHWNGGLQRLLVGVGVDLRLLQEDEMDSLIIELLVERKAFLCIAGHTGDRVEDYRIAGLELTQHPVKGRAVRRGSGVGLFNDPGIRIGTCDVTDLT